MQFDLTHKPDPTICPRQFCFCWQMARLIGSRTPEPVSIADGCRCPFGRCTRLDPENGDRDWYEYHGPYLRKAGLPWFYFHPSPDGLVPSMRQEYITESEALWGEEHWHKPAEASV